MNAHPETQPDPCDLCGKDDAEHCRDQYCPLSGKGWASDNRYALAMGEALFGIEATRRAAE